MEVIEIKLMDPMTPFRWVLFVVQGKGIKRANDNKYSIIKSDPIYAAFSSPLN